MTDMVNITIRLDRELKSDAETMFEDMGMNLSVAINVFLKQAVRQRQMPFNVKSDVSLNDPVQSEKKQKAVEAEHVTEIFELYGPWEDSRDAETIIKDIRGSRISKQDIIL
jgi:DNA-damage-inducible protein J